MSHDAMSLPWLGPNAAPWLALAKAPQTTPKTLHTTNDLSRPLATPLAASRSTSGMAQWDGGWDGGWGRRSLKHATPLRDSEPPTSDISSHLQILPSGVSGERAQCVTTPRRGPGQLAEGPKEDLAALAALAAGSGRESDGRPHHEGTGARTLLVVGSSTMACDERSMCVEDCRLLGVVHYCEHHASGTRRQCTRRECTRHQASGIRQASEDRIVGSQASGSPVELNEPPC